MREIKFRLWDKQLKQMLHTTDLEWYDDSFGFRLEKHTEDIEHDLMQYAGMIDKNGKEIYEGDILSYKHITYSDCSKTKIEEIEDESFIEIITYAPMASIVKPHSKNVKCLGYDSVNKECLIIDLTSDEVEVIGNIYENPELLG